MLLSLLVVAAEGVDVISTDLHDLSCCPLSTTTMVVVFPLARFGAKMSWDGRSVVIAGVGKLTEGGQSFEGKCVGKKKIVQKGSETFTNSQVGWTKKSRVFRAMFGSADQTLDACVVPIH
ncbi:hypothetical protein KC342_g109 [Hortaea werneckii]|nr:hypothetical protein KC342_g109 [Hortaea werneckii]